MIRRSVRACGGLARPIDPRSGEPYVPNKGFPYRHREVGGSQVYPGEGPYSLIRALKGENPIDPNKGKWKATYCVGGVYKPILDPERHFNCQDRFEIYSYWEMYKMWWTSAINGVRTVGFTWMHAIFWLLFWGWMEWRREPLEQVIERQEFFENSELYIYGCYYDHHKFSHMLAKRRANKYRYVNHDLDHEH